MMSRIRHRRRQSGQADPARSTMVNHRPAAGDLLVDWPAKYVTEHIPTIMSGTVDDSNEPRSNSAPDLDLTLAFPAKQADKGHDRRGVRSCLQVGEGLRAALELRL